MEKIRGVFMLAAAILAGWKAVVLPNGPQRWMAVLLVVLAAAMAAWHFFGKPQPPKPR